MNIWPGFVDLRMDCEGRRIDRFLANHNIAIFVDKNQIGDRDLREVFGQRIQPEMVSQDWVSNGNVTSNTLIEA